MGPVELELFNHRLAAVAEEMGALLAASGFSPNIKERRDFSCAVFDSRGELVAQAAHIPVHLGAIQLSVRAALSRGRLGRGDVIALNDPFAGGTHLPDLTLVAPVVPRAGSRAVAYVACRAHHADVGGCAPGSMALARDIFSEGIRLPPVRLVRGGVLDRDLLAIFLTASRVPEEREGDLRAQWAALRLGVRRLEELGGRYGWTALGRAMAALQDYSERLARAALGELRPGLYRARDYLDGTVASGPRIPIVVAVRIGAGRARIDFHGSAPQVEGPLNAPMAVTLSAVFYVFRALAGRAIPPNAGLMRPLKVVAPEGTVVNAHFPAAVAGGNVETSQRIVDVLLKALAGAAPGKVPAASAGSMSNVAIGGYDPLRRRPYTYYETVAGGAGGGPKGAGASVVHTHMTNTRNTPIELLEAYYPLRVLRYARRRGSGGAGRHRGGDGVVREIEVLGPAEASLLGERRRTRPYGLSGGEPGKPGRDYLVAAGRRLRLPGKGTFSLRPGDRLHIETPGGGGWGRKRRGQ